jgi:alpha-tubulin suppressor-like RCC1 family protein
MPKDDINYKFTENGIVYDFYDVFVPAENFRQPSLFVWGAGGSGALGNFGTTNRSTPVTTFAGGTTWKSVSCGKVANTAAIKTDGTLWVWGRNDLFYGQLGINASDARSTPVTTFAGGNNWKQVSAGLLHTVAIQTIDYI